MHKNLYDILKEKATNPRTRNQVCIEVAPREEDDFDLFTYKFDYKGETVVFSYNQVGKVTYKEFYDLVNLFIKHQAHTQELLGNQALSFVPLTICKKVYLDYIAIFLANLKLHRVPVLFPSELDEENFEEFRKYEKYFDGKKADFYIFSSGSTGIANRPKPVYERNLINTVYFNYIDKMNIRNEKFYSTMSMNGIAGVTFNAFFPIVTNNSIYINKNNNFFENIFYTKSTMFVLPLNYMDFLPLQDNSCNDYSHVNHILVSGGYFNTNDINTLLTNLPGLRKEAIKYLYSSTELEGNLISSDYNNLHPIKVSMPDLLNNKVTFSEGLESIEYLSSGKVDNKWKIIGKDNNPVKEDMLGIIYYNNKETDDIGFIHDNRLYVVGRKPDNDTYNLSIISNYFRYHLNTDVACGIYNDELLIYVDIINNHYGAYSRNLSTRRGIYQSYKDNFELKDKANSLIKYLEDNYELEFYGDVLLHKFHRNDRLEKIVFDYHEFNPFDTNRENTNGAMLFDNYYYISSHLENIFLIHVLFMLYNQIRKDRYFDGETYFKHMPLDQICDLFKKIYNNRELINRINNNPIVHQFFKEVLYIPAYISLDFYDMHHFDINHSNLTSEDLMHAYKDLPELSPEQRKKVQDLFAMFRSLQEKLHIDIHDKNLYSQEFIETRNKRIEDSTEPLLGYLEEIANGNFDSFIANELIRNEKKKS